MTGDIQTSRRTDNSSAFPCVELKNPSCILVVSVSRCTRVIFSQTLVHCSFQTGRGPTQVHEEESLFFVKGMVVALLSTAGVSDELAQELQMPIGPQMLDVEEPIPIKS